MEEIKYKDGDAQRILDTETFLDREYHYLKHEFYVFRSQAKLSVRQMGKLVGCSGMNISLIERGKVRPNRRLVEKFMAVRANYKPVH